VSRVFQETRKETHLSLTSTYPVWISETGVSGRDNNFSILSRVKLVAFMEKISRIEKKSSNNYLQIQKHLSNIFLHDRRKLRRKFPKFREDWPTKFLNPKKALAKIFPSRGGGSWPNQCLRLRQSRSTLKCNSVEVFLFAAAFHNFLNTLFLFLF